MSRPLKINEFLEVVRWAVYFFAGNLGVKAAYATFLLLLASKLPPAVYADFGIIYAVHTGVIAFSIVGLQEITAARLKHFNCTDERTLLFQQIANSAYVVGSLTTIILLLFSFFFLAEDGNFFTIAVAIFLGNVIGFSLLQANFHRLNGSYSISLLFSALVPMSGIIAQILALWLLGELLPIFLSGLFASTLALLWLITKGLAWQGTHLFSLSWLKIKQGFAAEILVLIPFLIIAIFGWISGYGMNLIINLQFDKLQIALFTFLYTIASLSQVVANSLNMIWAPKFFRLYNSGDLKAAEDGSRVFFSILALVLGIVGFMGVTLLPWVTKFFGGNFSQYGSAQLELALLMSGYVFSICFWHVQSYFHVTGLSNQLMRLTVWSGGLGLIAWIICMILFGVSGIFLGFAIQMLIKSIAMWHAGKTRWNVRTTWFSAFAGCGTIACALIF